MNKTIKNIGFVMVFMLIGKVCGAIYKIPLTSILGANGIGIYQLVFPIFVMLVMLSSSGTSLAITKLVSEGKMNYKKIFIEGLKFSLSISILLSLLLIIFSKNISILQQNENIYIVYYYLTIAIIFVSVLAIYRGLFRGFQDIKTYAISEFIEQISKLGFGLLFAYILMKKGVIYSVIGCFFGISLASIISIIYCIIKKKKYKFKDLSINFSKKKFYNYAIFGSLSSIITPISQFIDGIVIVSMLKSCGLSIEFATSNYGLMTGAVITIINLPICIIVAIETIALPSLSKENDENIKQYKANKYILYTFIISLFFAGVEFIFADEIINVLYNGLSKVSKSICLLLLKYGAINVFFISIAEIFVCIMQSYGNFYFPLISLTISYAIKLIAEILLLPKFGILGAQIAFVLSYSIMAIINLLKLYKLSNIGSNKKLINYSIIIGLVLIGLYLFRTSIKNYFNSFYILLFSGLCIFLLLIVSFLFIKIKPLKFVLRKR